MDLHRWLIDAAKLEVHSPEYFVLIAVYETRTGRALTSLGHGAACPNAANLRMVTG